MYQSLTRGLIFIDRVRDQVRHVRLAKITVSAYVQERGVIDRWF